MYLHHISNLWQVLSKVGGQAAIAILVGFFLATYFAPSPSKPAALIGTESNPALAYEHVGGWFGKQGAPVRIQLLGVIHSASSRSTAILRLDGGEPQVYKEGQQITSGVYLTRVEASGVDIEQQGQQQKVMMPVHPVPFPKNALQRLP